MGAMEEKRVDDANLFYEELIYLLKKYESLFTGWQAIVDINALGEGLESNSVRIEFIKHKDG